MDWIAFGSAAFLIVMLIFMFPRMRHAMKNAPKGTNNQWLGFVLIVGVVGLFVLLLIKMV